MRAFTASWFDNVLHLPCALMRYLACCMVFIPACCLLIEGCTAVRPPSGQSEVTRPLHPGRNGPLTPKEMELARTAWKYFENNYQPVTGFVNAADQYPSTTMWDTASYLGGLVAAFELGIIDKGELDLRLGALLNTFQNLNLFRDELPNKAYNTQTAEKVDYNNKPGEIGFSALDLGRLLIWLKIIEERYPQYADRIDNFILRWSFRHVLDRSGVMYGGLPDSNNRVMYVQEGRLGYEEYAAKGFQLWGFDTTTASRLEPYDFVRIYGIDIPYDTRDPREMGAHNYVVCESFILDGMELNWDKAWDRTSDDMIHSDPPMPDFAGRIYRVQEERYRRTGILTARTEHQLDGPPYFIYDTIYTDGYPWNSIADDGRYMPQFAALAAKAALGLWALYQTPYSDLLFDAVYTLANPAKGFHEGRYEKSGLPINTFTANNNGIILESLLYKVQGKLLKVGNRPGGTWSRAIGDKSLGSRQCLPGFQRRCTDNLK